MTKAVNYQRLAWNVPAFVPRKTSAVCCLLPVGRCKPGECCESRPLRLPSEARCESALSFLHPDNDSAGRGAERAVGLIKGGRKQNAAGREGRRRPSRTRLNGNMLRPRERILRHAGVGLLRHWIANGLAGPAPAAAAPLLVGCVAPFPCRVKCVSGSWPCRLPPARSGCQFLDCLVVVLRDGGCQRVPVVGVQLDDLQEEGAGQHGLRGAQHLVACDGQQLRHHLRQLFLQQSASALQLSGKREPGQKSGAYKCQSGPTATPAFPLSAGEGRRGGLSCLRTFFFRLFLNTDVKNLDPRGGLLQFSEHQPNSVLQQGGRPACPTSSTQLELAAEQRGAKGNRFPFPQETGQWPEWGDLICAAKSAQNRSDHFLASQAIKSYNQY